MSMDEPSQTKTTGIIIGVTIAGVIFLLFAFMVFAWYSRKMHRPRLVAGTDEGSEFSERTHSLSDSELEGGRRSEMSEV
jgi:hypothetical protein